MNRFPTHRPGVGLASAIRGKWHIAAIALILAGSTALKSKNLGHADVNYWDEGFHALVARNLLRHPMTPTLIETPYLPYDGRDWNWAATHVWLHKPILPLWTISLSYRLFGISPFALRLPSLLLSGGAVFFTFLICLELFDATAALVAASLQAFNPAIVELVQGYFHSDHVDISLLFWVECGMYFLVRSMRRSSRAAVVMTGLAMACAILSKSVVGLIVVAVALAVRSLVSRNFVESESFHLSWKDIGVFVAVSSAIVVPWMLSLLIRFPVEFAGSPSDTWMHIIGGNRGFSAPWDRVVFDYSPFLYGVFYSAILVAAIVLFRPRLLRRWEHALLYVWGLGVLIPFLCAGTKTPSATLIGLPPMYLLFGVLVSRAVRGDRAAEAFLTGIALINLVVPTPFPPLGWAEWGMGYPTPRVPFGVMLGAKWVIRQLLGAVVAGFILARTLLLPGSGGKILQIPRAGLRIATAILLAAMLWRSIDRARFETRVRPELPSFTELARFAKSKLPANAVLLFDTNQDDLHYQGDHMLTMLWSDRTCYLVKDDELAPMAAEIRRRGGIPYLASYKELTLPVLFHSTQDRRTIYSLASSF